jgi:hypothetical protein
MSRVHRLTATAFRIANAPRLRIAAQLLLAVALVFVALRLRSIWHRSHVDLGNVGWASMAGAGLLTLCGVVASAFIWLRILRRLGVTTRRRWVAVYFQAQLGKYIPGSFWQYAGRVALARAYLVPFRPLAVSLPVELAGSVAAAALVSMLLLGRWGLLGAALLVAVLHVLGGRLWSGRIARLVGGDTGQEVRVAVSAAVSAVPFYAATWVAVGSGFWLVARAMLGVAASDFLIYVGAFTAAWLVGLFAIYAPGGLGVREALLVVILRGRIGTADALVIAAASRVIFTLVDIFVALIGVLILRRSPKPGAYDRSVGGLSGTGS